MERRKRVVRPPPGNGKKSSTAYDHHNTGSSPEDVPPPPPPKSKLALSSDDEVSDGDDSWDSSIDSLHGIENRLWNDEDPIGRLDYGKDTPLFSTGKKNMKKAAAKKANKQKRDKKSKDTRDRETDDIKATQVHSITADAYLGALSDQNVLKERERTHRRLEGNEKTALDTERTSRRVSMTRERDTTRTASGKKSAHLLQSTDLHVDTDAPNQSNNDNSNGNALMAYDINEGEMLNDNALEFYSMRLNRYLNHRRQHSQSTKHLNSMRGSSPNAGSMVGFSMISPSVHNDNNDQGPMPAAGGGYTPPPDTYRNNSPRGYSYSPGPEYTSMLAPQYSPAGGILSPRYAAYSPVYPSYGPPSGHTGMYTDPGALQPGVLSTVDPAYLQQPVHTSYHEQQRNRTNYNVHGYTPDASQHFQTRSSLDNANIASRSDNSRIGNIDVNRNVDMNTHANANVNANPDGSTTPLDSPGKVTYYARMSPNTIVERGSEASSGFTWNGTDTKNSSASGIPSTGAGNKFIYKPSAVETQYNHGHRMTLPHQEHSHSAGPTASVPTKTLRIDRLTRLENEAATDISLSGPKQQQGGEESKVDPEEVDYHQYASKEVQASFRRRNRNRMQNEKEAVEERLGKPAIKIMFERFCRYDHTIDAKGIQAMCYENSTFYPLKTIITDMQTIIQERDDMAHVDFDKYDIDVNSLVLTYDDLLVWVRNQPNLEKTMRVQGNPSLEAARIRHNTAASIFRRHDLSDIGSKGRVSVDTFKEIHHELIEANIISYKNNYKEACLRLDMGRTQYIIFSDYMTWVDENNPKSSVGKNKSLLNRIGLGIPKFGRMFGQDKEKEANKAKQLNNQLKDPDYQEWLENSRSRRHKRHHNKAKGNHHSSSESDNDNEMQDGKNDKKTISTKEDAKIKGKGLLGWILGPTEKEKKESFVQSEWDKRRAEKAKKQKKKERKEERKRAKRAKEASSSGDNDDDGDNNESTNNDTMDMPIKGDSTKDARKNMRKARKMAKERRKLREKEKRLKHEDREDRRNEKIARREAKRAHAASREERRAQGIVVESDSDSDDIDETDVSETTSQSSSSEGSDVYEGTDIMLDSADPGMFNLFGSMMQRRRLAAAKKEEENRAAELVKKKEELKQRERNMKLAKKERARMLKEKEESRAEKQREREEKAARAAQRRESQISRDLRRLNGEEVHTETESESGLSHTSGTSADELGPPPGLPTLVSIDTPSTKEPAADKRRSMFDIFGALVATSSKQKQRFKSKNQFKEKRKVKRQHEKAKIARKVERARKLEEREAQRLLKNEKKRHRHHRKSIGEAVSDSESQSDVSTEVTSETSQDSELDSDDNDVFYAGSGRHIYKHKITGKKQSIKKPTSKLNIIGRVQYAMHKRAIKQELEQQVQERLNRKEKSKLERKEAKIRAKEKEKKAKAREKRQQKKQEKIARKAEKQKNQLMGRIESTRKWFKDYSKDLDSRKPKKRSSYFYDSDSDGDKNSSNINTHANEDEEGHDHTLGMLFKNQTLDDDADNDAILVKEEAAGFEKLLERQADNEHGQYLEEAERKLIRKCNRKLKRAEIRSEETKRLAEGLTARPAYHEDSDSSSLGSDPDQDVNIFNSTSNNTANHDANLTSVLTKKDRTTEERWNGLKAMKAKVKSIAYKAKKKLEKARRKHVFEEEVASTTTDESEGEEESELTSDVSSAISDLSDDDGDQDAANEKQKQKEKKAEAGLFSFFSQMMQRRKETAVQRDQEKKKKEKESRREEIAAKKAAKKAKKIEKKRKKKEKENRNKEKMEAKANRAYRRSIGEAHVTDSESDDDSSDLEEDIDDSESDSDFDIDAALAEEAMKDEPSMFNLMGKYRKFQQHRAHEAALKQKRDEKMAAKEDRREKRALARQKAAEHKKKMKKHRQREKLRREKEARRQERNRAKAEREYRRSLGELVDTESESDLSSELSESSSGEEYEDDKDVDSGHKHTKKHGVISRLYSILPFTSNDTSTAVVSSGDKKSKKKERKDNRKTVLGESKAAPRGNLMLDDIAEGDEEDEDGDSDAADDKSEDAPPEYSKENSDLRGSDEDSTERNRQAALQHKQDKKTKKAIRRRKEKDFMKQQKQQRKEERAAIRAKRTQRREERLLKANDGGNDKNLSKRPTLVQRIGQTLMAPFSSGNEDTGSEVAAGQDAGTSSDEDYYGESKKGSEEKEDGEVVVNADSTKGHTRKSIFQGIFGFGGKSKEDSKEDTIDLKEYKRKPRFSFFRTTTQPSTTNTGTGSTIDGDNTSTAESIQKTTKTIRGQVNADSAAKRNFVEADERTFTRKIGKINRKRTSLHNDTAEESVNTGPGSSIGDDVFEGTDTLPTALHRTNDNSVFMSTSGARIEINPGRLKVPRHGPGSPNRGVKLSKREVAHLANYFYGDVNKAAAASTGDVHVSNEGHVDRLKAMRSNAGSRQQQFDHEFQQQFINTPQASENGGETVSDQMPHSTIHEWYDSPERQDIHNSLQRQEALQRELNSREAEEYVYSDSEDGDDDKRGESLAHHQQPEELSTPVRSTDTDSHVSNGIYSPSGLGNDDMPYDIVDYVIGDFDEKEVTQSPKYKKKHRKDIL